MWQVFYKPTTKRVQERNARLRAKQKQKASYSHPIFILSDEVLEGQEMLNYFKEGMLHENQKKYMPHEQLL